MSNELTPQRCLLCVSVSGSGSRPSDKMSRQLAFPPQCDVKCKFIHPQARDRPHYASSRGLGDFPPGQQSRANQACAPTGWVAGLQERAITSALRARRTSPAPCAQSPDAHHPLPHLPAFDESWADATKVPTPCARLGAGISPSQYDEPTACIRPAQWHI